MHFPLFLIFFSSCIHDARNPSNPIHLFKLGVDLHGLLLATLGDVFDLEGCFFLVLLANVLFVDYWILSKRTRRQALLELVGLVRVLENESVQEAVAADLELGLAGLAVALDTGGYIHQLVYTPRIS